MCIGSVPDESCSCGDRRLTTLAMKMKTLMRPVLLDEWLSWCFCFLLVWPCKLFVLVMVMCNVDMPTRTISSGLLESSTWAMTRY